jgi:hypothetical protein
MQVISLGKIHSLDRKQVHRLHNGMDRELILEKLIEFAVTAMVVVGTGSEVDTALHMVNAGLLPGRAPAKDVLPEHQLFPPAQKGLPVVPAAIILLHGLPQGPVEPAFMALVGNPAHLLPNRPRLHPDALGTAPGFSETLNSCVHLLPLPLLISNCVFTHHEEHEGQEEKQKTI